MSGASLPSGLFLAIESNTLSASASIARLFFTRTAKNGTLDKVKTGAQFLQKKPLVWATVEIMGNFLERRLIKFFRKAAKYMALV
jgi:hypothetical protein